RTSIVGLNDGSRYDPSANRWTPTRTDATSPSARTGHVGLWTGSEMIIWGAQDSLGGTGTLGYRYDPSADSWTVMADALTGHGSGVWTGSRMIVWEGSTKGGRYDPATNSWTPTATAPVMPRHSHVAQWTGSLMLVWGGFGANGSVTRTGDRYDPLTDTWSPMS